jgi:hypothetical protein
VNDPPNNGGVGAPAAAVAAAGGSSEDLDVNKAPRINGLVVTPGGRVLVACPVSGANPWSPMSHILVRWALCTGAGVRRVCAPSAGAAESVSRCSN